MSKADRTWCSYYGLNIQAVLGRKIRETFKKVTDKYTLVVSALEVIERERVERGRSLVYADDLRELEWYYGVRYNDTYYLPIRQVMQKRQ